LTAKFCQEACLGIEPRLGIEDDYADFIPFPDDGFIHYVIYGAACVLVLGLLRFSPAGTVQ
jgi:hypothetical protein